MPPSYVAPTRNVAQPALVILGDYTILKSATSCNSLVVDGHVSCMMAVARCCMDQAVAVHTGLVISTCQFNWI